MGDRKLVVSRAFANIALIKYWGKRDEELFLPTKSSLSVTLEGLETTTRLNRQTGVDSVLFSGVEADEKNAKNIFAFLDLVRREFGELNGVDYSFCVDTHNSFPTSAGLASSASGFAALAAAVDRLCGLKLSVRNLSILARRGSGSASRSLAGGFVIWHRGESADGSDSFSEQVCPDWEDFRVLVAVVCTGEKKASSRGAMQGTVRTSPTYAKWIAESEEVRIPKMLEAIRARDFAQVGSLAEADCLDMHKCMQNSNPPVHYWAEGTVRLMDAVRDLRANGTACYFTIDAGPNVKVLCLEKDEKCILDVLESTDGVQRVIRCRVGGPAVVEDAPVN